MNAAAKERQRRLMELHGPNMNPGIRDPHTRQFSNNLLSPGATKQERCLGVHMRRMAVTTIGTQSRTLRLIRTARSIVHLSRMRIGVAEAADLVAGEGEAKTRWEVAANIHRARLLRTLREQEVR